MRQELAGRIVNVDLESRLRKLGESVSDEQLARVADFLRTIEIYLNTYVNRQMLTDVLALTSNEAVGKIANDNLSKSR